MPNDRDTASSAASSTVTQNRPGAARRRIPRSGSSANANSRSTISPKGMICCERHARAALDPQVLARDEPHLAPEGHATTPIGRTRRTSATGPTGPRLRPARRLITTSRVGERAGVVELVRREQHGAPLAPARRARPRRAPRGPRRRGRRAARRAAAAADRATAPPRPRGAGAAPSTAAGAPRRPGAASPSRSSAASASPSSRPAARAAKRRFSRTVRSS